MMRKYAKILLIYNIKEEENNLYLIFYTFVAVKEQKNVFKFIFLSFSPPATTTWVFGHT